MENWLRLIQGKIKTDIFTSGGTIDATIPYKYLRAMIRRQCIQGVRIFMRNFWTADKSRDDDFWQCKARGDFNICWDIRDFWKSFLLMPHKLVDYISSVGLSGMTCCIGETLRFQFKRMSILSSRLVKLQWHEFGGRMFSFFGAITQKYSSTDKMLNPSEISYIWAAAW